MTVARDRSRVAAATAAVVPFHCVICFGEFSTHVRFPVVLPCGHTYVCAPCSRRLKRCMECREPLFYTVRGAVATNATARTTAPPAPSMYVRPNPAAGGRISPTLFTPLQQQQQALSSAPVSYGSSSAVPTQVPFPLPKNVVLISMMEAAERHARESVTCEEDETNGSMNASDEEEEFDLNRIIGGMATLSGPCGTYAVKDPVGLRLLTADPRLDETVDDIDKEIVTTEHPQLSISASADSIEIKEPSALEKGQTVQVARFEDGVAILARRSGFIKATSSQLVKIGGPLEKSCRLEGVLETIVSRRNELQRELDENIKIEECLRREIENEMQLESSHPVVSDAPKLELSSSDCKDSGYPITPKAAANITNKLQSPDGSPDSAFHIGRSPDMRDFENPGFPFTINSIDNADLCGPGLPDYRSRGGASFDESYGYGCGAVLFETSAVLGPSDNGLIEHAGSSERGFGIKSGTRSRSHSPDGSHNHPGLGPTLTSSFDTIDFRTGMSGHRGLTNTTKLTPGNSPIPRGYNLRMSEHRGIARVRGPLLQRSSASNASS